MDTQASQVNLYVRYPSKQWTKFIKTDKTIYQVDVLLDEFIKMDIDNYKFESISFSRVNVSKDNKCGIDYLYSYKVIQSTDKDKDEDKDEVNNDTDNDSVQLIYGPSSYIAYINRLTD